MKLPRFKLTICPSMRPSFSIVWRLTRAALSQTSFVTGRAIPAASHRWHSCRRTPSRPDKYDFKAGCALLGNDAAPDLALATSAETFTSGFFYALQMMPSFSAFSQASSAF